MLPLLFRKFFSLPNVCFLSFPPVPLNVSAPSFHPSGREDFLRNFQEEWIEWKNGHFPPEAYYSEDLMSFMMIMSSFPTPTNGEKKFTTSMMTTTRTTTDDDDDHERPVSKGRWLTERNTGYARAARIYVQNDRVRHSSMAASEPRPPIARPTPDMASTGRRYAVASQKVRTDGGRAIPARRPLPREAARAVPVEMHNSFGRRWRRFRALTSPVSMTSLQQYT